MNKKLLTIAYIGKEDKIQAQLDVQSIVNNIQDGQKQYVTIMVIQKGVDSKSELFYKNLAEINGVDIKVIETVSSGFTTLVNTGLFLTKTPYIQFLDTNVKLKKSYFFEVLAILTANKINLNMIESNFILAPNQIIADTEQDRDLFDAAEYAQHVADMKRPSLRIWNHIYNVEFLKENKLYLSIKVIDPEADFQIRVLSNLTGYVECLNTKLYMVTSGVLHACYYAIEPGDDLELDVAYALGELACNWKYSGWLDSEETFDQILNKIYADEVINVLMRFKTLNVDKYEQIEWLYYIAPYFNAYVRACKLDHKRFTLTQLRILDALQKEEYEKAVNINMKYNTQFIY